MTIGLQASSDNSEAYILVNGTRRTTLTSAGDVSLSQSAPQFDADLSVATTAFVQRALGNWRGYAAYTAGPTVTLTAANCGTEIVLSGTSVTASLVLPKLDTVVDGAGFLIKCEATTSSWTIAADATDGASIVAGSAAVASVPIQRGDFAIVTRGGASSWRVHGTLSLPYSDQFANLIAPTGYQKLPGGLIMQWGSLTTSASADSHITFPIAFPTACNNRQVSVREGGGAVPIVASIGAHNLTGMSIGAFLSSTTARSSIVVDWIAIGD